MIEDLLPLGVSRPGFFANGTVYQSKGRWHEGNLVRFAEGRIGPIGGWAPVGLSGAAIQGTPLHTLAWLAEDETPFLAVGTTEGLYVIDDNNFVSDITPDPSIIDDAPFDWHLSTFGAYLIATNSVNGDGNIDDVNEYVWQGDVGVKADVAWTDAVGPTGAYSSFATEERFHVVLRGQDPSGHTARTGADTPYSARRVYFASREELDEFISTDDNTGGDFDLSTDGRLIVGAQVRGQSLLWTDEDVWTMSFIGGEFVFSFANAGRKCGIVGKRAFAVLDKGAYWMGRNKFFVYDGFTRALPCEVSDHVFGNFNDARAHTVWAVANAKFNEITWFYPSLGAQYPDSYVTYNYLEDHWVFGVLDRSAGIDRRPRQDVIDETHPYWFANDGSLFEHESGQERNAQAWLASGPIQLGSGDRLMRIQGIMPDDRQIGDMVMRIYTTMAPDALETLNGPFVLSPVTTIRLTARLARIRLEEAASGDDWRVGEVQLAVKAGERRGSGPGPIDTTPASLEIIPVAVTLLEAQHYTFQAIIRNAAGQVLDLQPDVWNSSESDDISINDTGTVTVNTAPATTNVTAEYTPASLVSNTAVVTVAAHVPASITIESTADVEQGTTTQLHAVVRDATGLLLTDVPLTWTTTDGMLVSVDDDGLLTGVSIPPDTADIQAHYISGQLPGDSDVDSNTCVATCTKHWHVHTFDGDNTFVVTTAGDAEILLVGGAASGGSVDGGGVGAGGGGGGGVVHEDSHTFAIGSFPITVGGGADPNFADHTVGGGAFGTVPGNPGNPTTFAGRTAGGGGRGGGADGTVKRQGGAGGDNAGSGGGGASAGDGAPGPTDYEGGAEGHVDDALTEFGNPGGDGVNTSTDPGAGGGGSKFAGSSGTGGAGLTFDIEDVAGGLAIEYGAGGDARYNEGGHTVTGFGHGGEAGGNALSAQGTAGTGGRVVVRYPFSSTLVATGGTKYTVHL